MDEIDAALHRAWGQKYGFPGRYFNLVGLSEEHEQARPKPTRTTGKYLSRPLRSFALGLRASDKRIGYGIPVAMWHDWQNGCQGAEAEAERFGIQPSKWPKLLLKTDAYGCGEVNGVEFFDAEVVDLCGRVVRWWCQPIRIDWPGIPVKDAAEKFGVSVNTIYRWEKQGRLHIRRFEQKIGGVPWPEQPPLGIESARRFPFFRRFPETNFALVVTNGPISPAGMVWSHDWGSLQHTLEKNIPNGFFQILVRARRAIGAQRDGQWQWICPGCYRLVYKMFFPMRIFTSKDFYAEEGHVVPKFDENMSWGFACHKCSKLVYESTERSSRSGDVAGAKPVDTHDYFIQRVTGGALRGNEVDRPRDYLEQYFEEKRAKEAQKQQRAQGDAG